MKDSRHDVIRVYTEETQDLDALMRAIYICVDSRIPFYYSGRKRFIRAQSRNMVKVQRLERQFKQIGLRTYVQYC